MHGLLLEKGYIRLTHKSEFCPLGCWVPGTKALGFISAIGIEKLIAWKPFKIFWDASNSTFSVSSRSQGGTRGKM